MNRPRVFITGMGHSGTTWCATMFAEAGFDLGESLKSVSQRQGREWYPAWDLIIGAAIRMGAREHPDRPYWWRIQPSRYDPVRREIEPRFAALDWPEVVKIPSTFPSLLWDLIDPEHIVLVVRDAREWARSHQVNGFMRDAIPHVADRMVQYRTALDDIRESLDGWPHTVVDFEVAVTDPDYAYERLGSLFRLSHEKFSTLHARVTCPEWVGLNASLANA